MVLHCTAGVPARISSTWMFAMATRSRRPKRPLLLARGVATREGQLRRPGEESIKTRRRPLKKVPAQISQAFEPEDHMRF